MGIHKDELISKTKENIENKNSLLDKIFDITIKQKQSLNSKDIDRFENEIEEKSSLFFKSVQSNKEFEDFLKTSISDSEVDLEDLKKNLIESDHKLRLLNKQTRDIVRNIEQIEKENLDEIKKIMQEIKEDMKIKNKVKKIEQSYYSDISQEENSYYFDSKK